MHEQAAESSFDVAVIGAGMIGAAAARHLCDTGVSTAVVGAVEPEDWRSGVGPFSSHYDAGRITRITANDPFWSAAAAASAARYADVESRSGISFHRPCGLAWVAADMQNSIDVGRANGAAIEELSSDELRSRTGIAAPPIDGVRCAFESSPAGVVEPRAHVAAELAVAKASGATVIADAATAVAAVAGSRDLKISGSFGEVRARRVLLATGGYGADFVGVHLELERRLRTIVRAEIGPGAEIPSLIAHDVEHEALEGIYWVPPLRYPDGRTMIKIGGDFLPVRTAASTGDIDEWFTTDGCPHESAALFETLRVLLPDATITSWDTRPCVVTNTPSSLPYIGWVDDNVCVAVGGNGAAAKSCDELGRLAAAYVTDEWANEPLDPVDFAPRLAK